MTHDAPNLLPEVAALPDSGRIGLFLGGAYRLLPIEAAKRLVDQLRAAIVDVELDQGKTR